MTGKRRIRLVALDLDRTLLTRTGEISTADAAALKGLYARGVEICLASGRMTDSIRPVADRLGIDVPISAYNGARVTDARRRGSRVIFAKNLPARYGDELIDYARENHFHLNYYVDDVLYAVDDPTRRKYADLYAGHTGSVYHFVPDLAVFKGKDPTKIILITDPSAPGEPNPRARNEQYEVWKARWDEEVTIQKTNPEYLEFMNRDVDKGVGLAALAQALGVPQEEVMAFGDAMNDAPMLKWAGVGVAVANADDIARAAADYVAPQTNDESAVARSIEALVEMEGDRSDRAAGS